MISKRRKLIKSNQSVSLHVKQIGYRNFDSSCVYKNNEIGIRKTWSFQRSCSAKSFSNFGLNKGEIDK